MTAFLKVSTAETIVIGPFVDSTDGVTAETALTISQADIRLTKNGAAFAQTNNAAGATHMENGHYSVPLNSTDTNTLGRLRVAVNESGALPVWRDFMVVPAQVWDSLYGADQLQVHVNEMTAGIITAAVIATDAIDADAIADNAINAAAIAADAITAAKIADGAIDAATFAAGAINAAAIAADAITDAKVASDVTIASVTGAVGSVTGNVGGNVVGSVASVTAGVTVTTNNDKTGYGLSAAAVQAIWDALTSALTTVGSIGKRIADNLDAAITSRMATFTYTTPPTVIAIRTEMDSNSTKLANLDTTISSRLATAGYTAPPTAAANADAVWDETLADHLAAGSTGNALNAAGGAGDPWATAIPGAYGAGTAGKILGDNINATISSRATQVSVDDLPTNAELATSQAAADDATLAAIAALNNLSAAQVNTEVDTALADYDAPTFAELDARTDAIDAALVVIDDFLDTEMAAALAAVDTEVAAIKAKTDNLPAAPAATGDIPAANTIADAVLSRGVSNVQDTADTTSLAALILATFESSAAGTVWTIRKTGGTTFVVKTLTLDAAADPVTGVT